MRYLVKSLFLVVLFECRLAKCAITEHPLFVVVFAMIDEFSCRLLQHIAFNFLSLHLNALLLVLLLNELHEPLELLLAIVSTSARCHMREGLYPFKISIILVKHFPEGVSECRRTVASDHHLVKVSWRALLKDHSDRGPRGMDHTEFTSGTDVYLTRAQCLAEDDFLHKHAFLCITLFDAIDSSGL